ncbi:DUF262 domain-containing protein [Glutamicibacter sp. NPDC087831]|uniref:DUF262 domain-containing protein n=1 Tax=Glutamicibacter sp. NPDC087831 TaxID=3363998 RepID=UPI00382499EF
MKIQTQLLPEISISRFRRMESVIDMNPAYQREGNVWKVSTQALLIDSIINGLDVPKLYFEAQNSRRLNDEGLAYQYAVIDGKQRLGAISAFLHGDLALPQDFIYFEDDGVNAKGMTISQLETNYPSLARKFRDFELPIVRVVTDSGDLIEEMFQRLNASSSLNAAERRNSLNVPTRDAANILAEHRLLVNCSPIRSARYKYRELGAKFLAIEHQISTKNKIQDTKSATLYDLFIATRPQNNKPARISESTMRQLTINATKTLDRMATIFKEDDPLLASIGTVVVYYIAFRDEMFANNVNRNILVQFEDLRREAAKINEDDPLYVAPHNVRLREYNGLVQSSNDGQALKRRTEILHAYVSGYDVVTPLGGIENINDGHLPDQDESEEP